MDILSGIPSPNLLPKGKSVVFGLLAIQQHQELLQTFDPRGQSGFVIVGKF